MSVSGLSRLLSFEEEDGQQLHLEISPRLLQGAAAADSCDAPAAAAEPPLPPPPFKMEPPAALPGSGQQQACRAQQVEQLQEYLAALRRLGSAGASGGLVHFPPEFPGLVHQLRQARLAECSEQRGGRWVGLHSPEACTHSFYRHCSS